MENPIKDVNVEEVDASLMLFISKWEELVAYFHNNRFPIATFCSSIFFNELLESHTNFKNTRCKKAFSDAIIEIVKGEVYPNKNWKADVDVIYRVAKDRSCNHWIRLAINIKNRTIEYFICNHLDKNKE